MEGFDTINLISYSRIFPTQEHKLEDLLKTIPSKKAIEFTSNILFKLGGNKENVSEYRFTDQSSLLILLQYLIENHNDSLNVESEDDLSNLYIAYLICCDERLRLSPSDLTTVQNIDDKISLVLPELLRLDDFSFHKVFEVELMRFYYFMTFCEQSEAFKPYLETFIEKRGLKSWVEYCRFILDTYSDLDKGNTNVIIIDKNDYRFSLINSLTLKISDLKRDTDFKPLREKPVYSVEENRYVILYIGFFIDKLFQSFLFDLASVLINKSSFPEIKDYPSLKQKVGNYYSEKYLFYTIMKGCFSNQMDKLIEGEALKKLLKDKEPDYYIRNGNNIFLFEFKDVAFDAKTKHCENIVTIKEELCELFVLSTKEKGKKKRKPQKKGISQLLNCIETQLDLILANDDTVSDTDFNVYPILVYEDSSFGIEGINYILNEKFQEERGIREIHAKYCVKELVMIKMEDLFMLEDLFKDAKLQLKTLIDDYLINCKSIENELQPFGKFMVQTAWRKGHVLISPSRYRTIYNNLVKRN